MNMVFQGRLVRTDNWWVAEIPAFDAATQGRTRKEALAMVEDWFRSIVGRRGFSVRVRITGKDVFHVGSEDTRTMISLLLRRQRLRSGLTLAQVAARLDAKSRNAYARYEQGLTAPTLEKFVELLRVVAPDRDLVVLECKAA